MKEHDFTLILNSDPNDEESDTRYGIFSDGTISTVTGVPQIHFYRASSLLEQAISSAIADVRRGGFEVEGVEMEPDAVIPSR